MHVFYQTKAHFRKYFFFKQAKIFPGIIKNSAKKTTLFELGIAILYVNCHIFIGI